MEVDPSCIWRWVQAYGPELSRRCRAHLKSTNKSYRTDETYIRVNGRWTNLYRAVDKQGRTVDFQLSERRDVAAAKAFFRQAMKHKRNASRHHARCLCGLASGSS